MDYWAVGRIGDLKYAREFGFKLDPERPRELILLSSERDARHFQSACRWKGFMPPAYMKVTVAEGEVTPYPDERSIYTPLSPMRGAIALRELTEEPWHPVCELPPQMDPPPLGESGKRRESHIRHWPLTGFRPAVYGNEHLKIPEAPAYILTLTEELRRVLLRGDDFADMIESAEAAGFRLNMQITKGKDGVRAVTGWSFTKGDVTVSASSAGLSFAPELRNPRSYDPEKHFAWLDRKNEASKLLRKAVDAERQRIVQDIHRITAATSEVEELKRGLADMCISVVGRAGTSPDKPRIFFGRGDVAAPYHKLMGSPLLRAARAIEQDARAQPKPAMTSCYHVTSAEAAAAIREQGFEPNWGDAGFGVYLFTDAAAAEDYAAAGGWDGSLVDPVILEIRAPVADIEAVIPEPDWPDPETYEHVVWHRMTEGDGNWRVEILPETEPESDPAP